MKRSLLFLTLLLTLVSSAVFAQDMKISGTVSGADGSPIPGATVKVSGTTTGTVTDVNGHYELTAASGGQLEVSSIGYQSQTVIVPANGGELNITLQVDAKMLQETVVTALGIQRQKKSLGYAVQEIKGETLTDAREPNLANALTGKVAGLQVIRSSTGPAGSSKIILRGYNSLTGNNQPLIVVDGTPIDNFTGMSNNDYWNPSLDMGNGLADINAEDIASVSVLKGPSAAALYGSRAGNGVILITTKTGKKQDGLGLTISSTIGVESIFTNPEMQNSFGQGSNGIYDAKSGSSWGPKIAGQSVKNWDSTMVPMRAYDNIGNYIRTGITSNQSVSFSQQYKSTSIYSSFNRLDDKSIIPGAKLARTNLLARAVTRFGQEERWTLDTKVQYNNSDAENRPQGGNNVSNVFHTMYLLPRSLDITGFNPPVDQYGKMVWYAPTSSVNPYWASLYNLNSDIRDRFIMNASLKYDFNNWLNAELKAGGDLYTTNTEGKTYAGSPITTNGHYSAGKSTFSETNYSALVTARKDNIAGKLGGFITVGGNLMSQKSSGISASSGELVVPDLFSLNNGKDKPSVSEAYSRKKINSVFGSAELNWDGYLFLDATFRNDWSSSLSKVNRSFFYPSLSLSYVFTDMMQRMGHIYPNWLSYAKLRASVAEVGNDLSPYQLYNTFSISKDPNGNTSASKGKVLYDPNVRSELIKSYELGAELRFLDGRLGVDFSWYKSNATRQLIDIPMDPLSGYTAMKVNAGNIQNTGIELMLDARILNNPDALSWNMSVNFSNNKNTVEELTTDITSYSLGGYDAVQVLAVAGQKYGEIYGTTFQRVDDPESQYYGRLLLSGAGLPQQSPDKVKLGNQQADFLLGVNNSFSYKGLGLSFQVDGRFGGEIFSGTLANMEALGTAAVTVVNGERPEMIVPGVVYDDAAKTYSENTQKISSQQYWQAVQADNIGITEANLYDATNVRLRNVQLSYQLPQRFLTRTPIQKAKVGISCNNVWLISSHMRGLDPESVFATGTNAVGFEDASPPTSRVIMFNLSLSF